MRLKLRFLRSPHDYFCENFCCLMIWGKVQMVTLFLRSARSYFVQWENINQPNDHAAKSLQQKKMNCIMALFIIYCKIYLYLIGKCGEEVQDVSFFKQKKKRVLFVGSNGNPFFCTITSKP